jgi:thioredoxin 1
MADVLEVTDDTFENEVNGSELPVLVDFWAPWCGPCKMVAPIVEGVAGKYSGKLKVVKCNVDEAPNTATQHNIRAIPTLALIKGGKVAEVMVGVQSEADLSQKIDGVLAE